MDIKSKVIEILSKEKLHLHPTGRIPAHDGRRSYDGAYQQKHLNSATWRLYPKP